MHVAHHTALTFDRQWKRELDVFQIAALPPLPLVHFELVWTSGGTAK